MGSPYATVGGSGCVAPQVETTNDTRRAARRAFECVAALARTRECRQNCVRFLRIADLKSTDSTCSSSSATWNDVRFELKHRARMGAT